MQGWKDAVRVLKEHQAGQGGGVVHVLRAVVEKEQGGWQGHQEGHHTRGYCTGVEACRAKTSLSDVRTVGAPGRTCQGQEGTQHVNGMAGSLWLEHRGRGY